MSTKGPGRVPAPTLAVRTSGLLLLASLVLVASWGWPRPGELQPAAVLLGERMYREGVRPTGEPLRGIVQGDVPLTGAQTACASCHRRSGFGSVEGTTTTPPVLGTILYQPVPSAGTGRRSLGTRPAYTDASLLHALRDGVDPAGRTLDPIMPRLDLSDEDGAALTAYLKSMSPGPDPGVSRDEIHLATIVTSGVEPRRRQAVVDLLRAYVETKNAQMRNEPGRRSAARRSGSSDYQGYRTWVLHVWELSGHSTTWGAQLASLYASAPVFAVIGGVGIGPWAAIHAFCEAHHLPCLLPNTELPELGGSDVFTVYFSRGLTLEAEALATFLLAAPPDESPLVQVFREETAAPAAALERALSPGLRARLVNEPIGPSTILTRSTWHDLLNRTNPGTLVLWLERSDLTALAETPEVFARVSQIILPGSLLGDDMGWIGTTLRPRVLMTYPRELPGARAQRFARTRAWLRARDLQVLDETLQGNTLLAVTLTGDTLDQLRGRFVRELFLETIEHMLDSALPLSAYPQLSLGPGERFAAKGCYVVKLSGDTGPSVIPASAWIVP